MGQTGAYALASKRRKLASAQQTKRFSGLLAEGYSISAAAAAIGVSQQAGSQYMARIRRELGWQAQ